MSLSEDLNTLMSPFKKCRCGDCKHFEPGEMAKLDPEFYGRCTFSEFSCPKAVDIEEMSTHADATDYCEFYEEKK